MKLRMKLESYIELNDKPDFTIHEHPQWEFSKGIIGGRLISISSGK